MRPTALGGSRSWIEKRGPRRDPDLLPAQRLGLQPQLVSQFGELRLPLDLLADQREELLESVHSMNLLDL